MKKILLPLLAVTAIGQAQAYQAEVGGGFDTGDYTTGLNVGGEFHINGVNATTGPFAEASFIDQSTFVRARFEDNGTDFGYGRSFGTNLVGGGRFVHKETGYYADANLILGNTTGIEVGAGLYLQPNTTVGGHFISNDFVTLFGASGKHLMSFEGGTYLNIEAGFEFGENDFFVLDGGSTTRFFGEGDYYLNKTLSVGAGLAFFDRSYDSNFFGEFYDDSGIELSGNAKMFLEENIVIFGGATLVNGDFGGSSFGINFGGSMRF